MNRISWIGIAALGLFPCITAAQTVQHGPVTNPANGHRYTRLSPMRGPQAQAAAAARGGYLVTIRSAQENEWVRANVAAPQAEGSGCLIGLNDAAQEGSYVWHGGQPLTYVNFDAGEPDDFGGVQDYVVMMPATGLWGDVPAHVFPYATLVEVEGPIRVPQEFPSIQAAIAAAIPGQTILVSPGTYPGGIDFLGKDITLRSTDGPLVTTIAGSTGAAVVTFSDGSTRAATLEGFRITGGNGIGGGGIAIGANSSSTIASCIITGNTAAAGGGIYSDARTRSTLLVNSVISGNSAQFGGGLVIREGGMEVLQCVIASNSAPQNSGLIVVPTPGHTTFLNSVVWGHAGSVPLEHTQFIQFRYCNVQTPQPGEGNISVDPRLNADGSLRPGSPCIDSGEGRAFGPRLDMLGQTRVVDDPTRANVGIGVPIDMGAIEFQPPPPLACPADFNADQFVNPDDLADYITAFFVTVQLGCP
jgi:hypothetical protein